MMSRQSAMLLSANCNTMPGVEFWRDAGLPFFEGRRAVASVSCYTPHTHPTWSIGIVDSGCSTFSLPQQQVRIHPGDVVRIAANEVHSCNPDARHSWSYRMFHLDCDWLCGLLTEAGLDPEILQRSQVLSITEAQRAVPLMADISNVMCRHEDSQHKETVLIASLCELFSQPLNSPTTPALLDERLDLRPVHQYLQNHCCDKISLEQLAQLAGIGRYQLIRLFRRHYGMTPHAMQLDMRINVARDLLRRGVAVAEIAYRTGFADQSHFHRAFKSRSAVTPAQFQHA
jgi:AraC-like DNA-binding protein